MPCGQCCTWGKCVWDLALVKSASLFGFDIKTSVYSLGRLPENFFIMEAEIVWVRSVAAVFGEQELLRGRDRQPLLHRIRPAFGHRAEMGFAHP